MITAIISKVLNLRELDQLDRVKRNLFSVVKKHKRKLIRIKLYLNWESKYETRTVIKWVLRVITGRVWGEYTQVSQLQVSYNRLSYLIDLLETSSRQYLDLVKQA